MATILPLFKTMVLSIGEDNYNNTTTYVIYIKKIFPKRPQKELKTKSNSMVLVEDPFIKQFFWTQLDNTEVIFFKKFQDKISLFLQKITIPVSKENDKFSLSICTLVLITFVIIVIIAVIKFGIKFHRRNREHNYNHSNIMDNSSHHLVSDRKFTLKNIIANLSNNYFKISVNF